MTNQEYLILQLSKFNITTDDIALILLESGIDGTAPVSNLNGLKTAVYNYLPGMMAGLSGISEGGYSIRWNYDGLKAWYSFLASELGLPDKLTEKPTVTGVSPW